MFLPILISISPRQERLSRLSRVALCIALKQRSCKAPLRGPGHSTSDGVNCEGPKDKEAKLATENCQKMEKWGLLQFDNAWKVKNVNDGGEPKLVCEVLHWPEDDQLMTGC